MDVEGMLKEVEGTLADGVLRDIEEAEAPDPSVAIEVEAIVTAGALVLGLLTCTDGVTSEADGTDGEASATLVDGKVGETLGTLAEGKVGETAGTLAEGEVEGAETTGTLACVLGVVADIPSVLMLGVVA